MFVLCHISPPNLDSDFPMDHPRYSTNVGGLRLTAKQSKNTLSNEMCWLRCFGRQIEMKGRTSSMVNGRPQPTAVRLYNGTADGQPHAAALRLGGKERRKDLIHLLRWQPHARVTDRELELTVLQFRLHRKLSAGVLHGFDGVEHEVHEHLLQLDTISHDFGQVGRKFCAHGDRVPVCLAFQQSQ